MYIIYTLMSVKHSDSQSCSILFHQFLSVSSRGAPRNISYITFYLPAVYGSVLHNTFRASFCALNMYAGENSKRDKVYSIFSFTYNMPGREQYLERERASSENSTIVTVFFIDVSTLLVRVPVNYVRFDGVLIKCTCMLVVLNRDQQSLRRSVLYG